MDCTPDRHGLYEKVHENDLDPTTFEEEGLFLMDEKTPSRSGHQHDYHRSLFSIRAFMVTSSIGLALILAVCLYSLNLIATATSSKVEEPERTPASSSTIHRVCGNTAAEARLLGCEFDQLTWAWLSPSCPRYASQQFADTDDFLYYSDPANRVVVSAEDWDRALDNEVPLFTERREHLSHCVYTFLSLAQIVRDGTPTHPKLSAYEHIEYCAKMVLESMKRDKDWNTVDADMGNVSYDEGC